MLPEIVSMIEDYLIDDKISNLEEIKALNKIYPSSKNRIPELVRKLYFIKKYKKEILLDAVSAGVRLPYVSSSLNYPDEDDIREISDLFPESNTSREGLMRCRYNVFPAVIAWNNPFLSKSIRYHLLDKLENPLMTYRFNCSDITMEQDLENSYLSEFKEYLLIKKLKL